MSQCKCPNCGKDDLVRKVSAVYAEGTSAMGYTVPVQSQYRGYTLYGSQQHTAINKTGLAYKLSPPVLNLQSSPGATLKGGIYFAILTIIAQTIAFAGFFGFTLGGLVLVAKLFPAFVNANANTIQLLTNNGSLVCFVVIGYIFSGFICQIIAMLVPSPYRTLIKKERERARELKLIYQQKAEEWNKEYYCGRCDIVFIPNE